MADEQKRWNSLPDLDAELQVSIERFPYKIYLGKKLVAHVFTHVLLKAFAHSIKHIQEMNELKERYNLLVDAVKGRSPMPDPLTLTYEKKIIIEQDIKGDDFFKAYGVKTEQIWKTKKSYHCYEIIEIDQSLVEVTMKWLGPYKYIRTLTVDSLKKSYELVENANKNFILAVTKVKEDAKRNPG